MDVDTDNLSEVLPSMVERLNACDFVAMDMEMSGLTSSEKMMGKSIDSLQERYEKVKNSAEQFAVLQVGLSLFRWEEDNKLIAEPYNFWIFPGVCIQDSKDDTRLRFQAGSLKFLGGTCDFDFNRSFKKGLSYLNEKAVNEAVNQFNWRKERRMQTPEPKKASNMIDKRNLKPDATAFLAGARSQAIKLLQNPTDFPEDDQGNHYVVLDPGNPFFRRLVYEDIPTDFSDIHVGSFPEDNVDSHKHRRNESKLRLTLKKEGNNLDDLEKARQEKDAEDDRVKLDAKVGFSHVIQALIKAKKPLIGHNCVQDVAHMFTKFVGPMPEDLEQFRSEFHEKFPVVVDSKYFFSAHHELHAKVPDTELGKCFKVTELEPFKASNPLVVLPDEFKRYDFSKDESSSGEAFHHEAGFDSFMTGIIFARALAFLQVEYDREKKCFRRQLESGEVEDGFDFADTYFNQLNLSQLSVPLSFTRANQEVDRSLLVRLCNFPASTRTGHIQRVLSDVLGVNRPRITWESDSGAFFFAPNKEALEKLLKASLERRSKAHVGTIAENSLEKFLSLRDLDIAPFSMWKAKDMDDKYDFQEDIRSVYSFTTTLSAEPTIIEISTSLKREREPSLVGTSDDSSIEMEVKEEKKKKKQRRTTTQCAIQ